MSAEILELSLLVGGRCFVYCRRKECVANGNMRQSTSEYPSPPSPDHTLPPRTSVARYINTVGRDEGCHINHLVTTHNKHIIDALHI